MCKLSSRDGEYMGGGGGGGGGSFLAKSDRVRSLFKTLLLSVRLFIFGAIG